MFELRSAGSLFAAAALAAGCASVASGGAAGPVTGSGPGASSSAASGASGTARASGAGGSIAGTASPGSTGATTTVAVRLYFLRTGGTLVPVYRQVPVQGGAVGTAAMKALLAGPTAAERAAGVSSTIPTGTALRGLNISKGIADVDLTAAYTTGGGTLSMTARVGEVVYTLTQFSTVQGVNFRIDGKPLTVLGGEGIILPRPATRAHYESLLPPIFIDSPAMGQPVTSPVRVTGVANVFEGQFRVEVRGAGGKVLAGSAVTAGMGAFTPFAVSVPYQVTAAQQGTVVGFDYSAKDGSVIDVFSVPVTLR